MLSLHLKSQQPLKAKFKQQFLPPISVCKEAGGFNIANAHWLLCTSAFSQFKHSRLSTPLHFPVRQSCCLRDFFFFN